MTKTKQNANAKIKTKATKEQVSKVIVTASKELKYIYPKDVLTKDQKKVFRRKARTQRNKFIKVLQDLKGKQGKKDVQERKGIEKDYLIWQKGTLSKVFIK